jgi:hypothetical protein
LISIGFNTIILLVQILNKIIADANKILLHFFELYELKFTSILIFAFK